MKIAFIGKFRRLYDEEYVARSFEMLGHEVVRIEQGNLTQAIYPLIEGADILLFTKLIIAEPRKILAFAKEKNIPSVCWVFDLYWNYPREYRLANQHCFRADFVFSTDGGEHDWEKYEINHQCVRQGIFKDECFLDSGEKKNNLIFVGSENEMYPYRGGTLELLKMKYADFEWFGRHDTHEMRGVELNKLYAETKVVFGDSVFSPHYWSNRVVETLGRGGFLIHPDVPGIKEEYPDLVTYTKGDMDDLTGKIDYYLTHDKEREAIIKKNFNLVKSKYTMDKKCAELLSKL